MCQTGMHFHITEKGHLVLEELRMTCTEKVLVELGRGCSVCMCALEDIMLCGKWTTVSVS